MDANDIALCSMILSALSLLIAGSAFVITRNHNISMRGLAASAPELNLLTQANAARGAIEEAGLKIAEYATELGSKKLTHAEKAKTVMLNLIYKSKIEALMNIFELACSFYVDKYVDPVRFRKLYFTEIKKLIDTPNEEIQKRMMEFPCPYPMIEQVYKEWNR